MKEQHFEITNTIKTIGINYDKETNFKILVWPNITKLNTLEKDSYVIVLKEIIKYVKVHYPDVHWTVVTPKEINYGEGVHTIICNFPEHPNAMRVHFDLIEFEKKLLHRINDYDIVYSHLPEHTLQLSNYFYNHTGLRPRMVGYCHWYEVSENDAPDINTFNANILGTLEMEECGINSNWLKKLILEKSSKTFNEKTVDKLQRIIQPHRLGIDMDFKESKIKLPRSILFNHRSDGYTGWNRFLKLMDRLWEKRKDFKVYMTFPTEDNRPYLEKIKLNSKPDYYDFIKQVIIGVCMFENYSAWSLSTADGLSRGIPYLLPKKLCYPEMVGDQYSLFYENDEHFLARINWALDYEELHEELHEELKAIATRLSWEESLKTWFGGWKIFDSNTYDVFKNSEIYEKNIIPFIKKNKVVTKFDLLKKFGWGYNIDWGYYRNMLRLDNRVKLYVDRYEFIG